MVGNIWKKFVNPTVRCGQTIYPPRINQEEVGIQYDYNGEIMKESVVYHKYNIQPNAGKIKTAFKNWRDTNGDTHATMTSILVKKDGTKDDVKAAVEGAADLIIG
ncbi:hypothetical protein LOZ53_003930 [Ophidiomyces ophidiicola]|nr:hypothetical protein LOZ55_004697 [Ophidiomyces ophidiicola]KAI1986098.1 hypothetical protein LOZ54_004002 [Ophidiomyces ophidiicola]KAI1988477.1 hypothetical protein LOZ53_003930 [Ophidiomyces ophidiicola]KAI1988889.1 hypothetical protein LOZ51_005276 [Ophidiomyces ophidiicola]